MAAAGRPTADLEASTPTFPYKVIERLIQARTGSVPTTEQTLKIGLLALQSGDCGATFMEIVDELSKAPHVIDDTLHQLAASTQAYLRDNLAPLFDKMAKPECSGFSSRPVLHEAIAHMRDLCQRYLTERGHNVFFEVPLGRMDPNDIESNKCFLDRFTSCTIQHFGRQRDDLFYVGTDERSDRELQVMGAYQGFGYYMWAHLRIAGLVPTRSLGRLTCCLHGSCDAPFARTHSHVCQNTPWQAFDRHGTNRCWFAAGVGHARGLQATPPNFHLIQATCPLTELVLQRLVSTDGCREHRIYADAQREPATGMDPSIHEQGGDGKWGRLGKISNGPT